MLVKRDTLERCSGADGRRALSRHGDLGEAFKRLCLGSLTWQIHALRRASVRSDQRAPAPVYFLEAESMQQRGWVMRIEYVLRKHE